MTVKKFKFVSPSVKIAEIDNSQLTAVGGDIGTLVIGRANRGPAMKPVKVSSFSEFVETFGEPTAQTVNGDIWRENVIVGPTYGVYAAQAALRSSNSFTFVRLLGTEHSEATANSGEAGWKVGAVSATQTTGGAYGLFVFPSGSSQCTGTLAAVWYLTEGSLELTGNIYASKNLATTTGMGSSGMFESDANKQFRIILKDGSGTEIENTRFDFDRASDKFVRKVFSTNPTLLNSSLYVSADRKKYFLGESFEDHINAASELDPLRASTKWVGCILALKHNTSATGEEHCDRRTEFTNSQTGWFFSQDFNVGESTGSYQPQNMTKLFKLHALDSGEWNQSNIKVSIRNIKVSDNSEFSPYGTFDVVIRRIDDSDDNVQVLEQFVGCNLNPDDADNYICAKIGDKYTAFDHSSRLNKDIGVFDNRSKYVRVEVADKVVSKAIVPQSLPFGVYGPVTYKSFAIVSGSSGFGTYKSPLVSTAPFVKGNAQIAGALGNSNIAVYMMPNGTGDFTGSVIFPRPLLRADTTTGSLSNPSNAYFGVHTDTPSGKFARSIKDVVRSLAAGVSSFAASDASATEHAWYFTLDDVKYLGSSTTEGQYLSGSRVLGTSITAGGSYQSVLNAGFNNFTTVMNGGFDGLDIREIEPFRNTETANKTDKNSYEFNTIKRAIDICRDREDVQFNVISVPGVTNATLTNRLLAVCEERGDAIAIIDCENDFLPRSENSSNLETRTIAVTTTVSSMKDRNLNTSYGAAYSTWANIRDTITNNIIPVPPSVIAVGTLAYNDAVAAPYYAPAGFSRGNVSNGSSGLNVVSLVKRLRESDRDKLYEVKVNSIANISTAGIVVWGQKTLLSTTSALNRINVRRAMIHIERLIADVAYTIIFDPNAQVTWNRFVAKADPILRTILVDNGISDYKLIFDASTNTPDNIDNNVAYGKIFIKPSKAIEFIGLDFSITPQGANFEELS
jgi:hypothetical protein